MALFTYQSTEEYAKLCKDITPGRSSHDMHFNNHITYEQAIEKTLHGDASVVPQAQKLLDKLDVELPETKIFESIRSPFGGRVNMSEWLAGAPTPCRRKVKRSRDYAPINIYVSLTCSWGIKAETMQARGATILALLMKLQTFRSVQLWVYSELHGAPDGWHYDLVKIDSQPLDLAVAAYVLSDVSFSRQLTLAMAERKSRFNGKWPNDYYNATYNSNRAKRLGLTESDLLIGEVYLTDPLITTPLKWLQDQIQRYAEGGETE